jgi:hypothetical protein
MSTYSWNLNLAEAAVKKYIESLTDYPQIKEIMEDNYRLFVARACEATDEDTGIMVQAFLVLGELRGWMKSEFKGENFVIIDELFGQMLNIAYGEFERQDAEGVQVN